jgi:arylsulfatase A-like enzyme
MAPSLIFRGSIPNSFGLLFVCALVGSGVAADTPRRPNVLVILADDLGYADLDRSVSQIRTPNLNRLAGEGVRLTRFYASAPFCSPTRAALLTGRYPHSVGVPDLCSPNVRGRVPILALDHDAITLPEALKPHGYTSVLVGKWHLGFYPGNRPRDHGFDEFWGSLIGTPGYYPAKETYHNETPIETDGYFTDRITEKAVEYLRRYRDAPLFLYVAYNAPHYPLQAPQELIESYRKLYPDFEEFAKYAAMVERLDDGVGKILTALDELQLRDETLVVFSSDNGPQGGRASYGDRGADISNGRLRGYKMRTYEGGIRVPFIARWPGRVPAGSVQGEPAITMDLLPTVLDAAGIKVDPSHEVHGRSILPLLTGKPFNRHEALHWETASNYASLRGDWKLVHNFVDPPELFDLSRDVEEQHDLATTRPEIAAELLRLHSEWKRRHYPHPIR